MEQKENMKPAEFDEIFGNISQDSLNLEAMLAKQPLQAQPGAPPQPANTQPMSEVLDSTINNNKDAGNQDENTDLSVQAPDTTLGNLSIGPALTTGPPSFESEDILAGLVKQVENEPAGDTTSEKKISIDGGEKVEASSTDQISMTDSRKSSKIEQDNLVDSENITVVCEAEIYADDLARKLLDDTNNLVRLEPGHSAAASIDTTSTTNLTTDDKNFESKADSITTEEKVVGENEESSKGNEEGVKEDNDKEPGQEQMQEACMENKIVNEPLRPLEIEPELEESINTEVEGDKLEYGDNTECIQTDGNGEENNGSSNSSRKDSEDEKAVEEVADEATQQQELNNEEPQELVLEEEKEKEKEEEKRDTVDTDRVNEVIEEEEEDIDQILRRFERDTESEPSVSEKEELLELKERKQEELITREDVIDNLKQETAKMEFAKNYSDDLLMGHSDQAELLSGSTGADLADFELPPHSGSSSGSEPRQHSPEKSKSSAQQQASSSSSNQVNIAPPDLTAVKNLLMSHYSKVSYIFRWKKPIETGLYFSIGATLIIALTFFSIISVVAYSALGLIASSSLIRVYKAVMKTLGKSTETPFDHVWDKVLSTDVSLSSEKTHQLLDASLGSMNSSFVYFKQVILVEDKLATLKFGLFLYMLTYIGAWFNGMTLITITYLALFLVPIFYEKNKTKIDGYVNLASGQLTSAINMVTGKVSSTLFGGSSANSSGSKKQN